MLWDAWPHDEAPPPAGHCATALSAQCCGAAGAQERGDRSGRNQVRVRCCWEQREANRLYKPGPRALLLKIAARAALLALLCVLQPQPGEAAAGAWTDTPPANYCGGLITAPVPPQLAATTALPGATALCRDTSSALVASPRGERAHTSSARRSTSGSERAFASQQPCSKQGWHQPMATGEHVSIAHCAARQRPQLRSILLCFPQIELTHQTIRTRFTHSSYQVDNVPVCSPHVTGQ